MTKYTGGICDRHRYQGYPEQGCDACKEAQREMMKLSPPVSLTHR